MILPETALLFFGASVALALAPGPDNIFVLAQSALHGRVAGFFVTLGLCTGLLVHTVAVSLGVAAVIQASSTAFQILKIAGASYLVYLAWGAFRAQPVQDGREQGMVLGKSKLYFRGVLMNLSNPKVIIFFLAFLPQFVDAGKDPVWRQILILGFIFMIATLLVFTSVAWTAGTLGTALKKSPGVQLIINRVAGTVFLALALKLLFSRN